jgi:ComF family protein
MDGHLRFAAAARVQTWSSFCVDLIFPPACAGCGRNGYRICPACAQAVEPAPPTICGRCGRVQLKAVACCEQCQLDGTTPLRRVRAAGLHATLLREFIHQLKYEQRPELAAPLARYLVAALARPDWDDLRERFDAVTPVPLHAERRKERGYNQAELLAQGLCRRTGIPFHPELLERRRFTHSQVGLNAVERHANVEDAFAARPACKGRHVLLVDDVYTTGATLRACAQALNDGGAALVCAITLAMPAHTTS